MKKFFKWVGILIGVFAAYVIIVVGYSFISGKFSDGTKGYNNAKQIIVRGMSMEQYGINDGDTKLLYFNQECEIGNNCSFTCNVPKCSTAGNNYVKKVVSKKDGCYWFEGNPESVSIGEHKLNSFDSRAYGKLCGDELTILGVVR